MSLFFLLVIVYSTQLVPEKQTQKKEELYTFYGFIQRNLNPVPVELT